MKPSISKFGIDAQKLSKNPLGIIALFIVLVYGIAALVLGLSSNNLQSDERLPIIYFLVIFPAIVLIVFYRLVVHHHVKLYAPSDFPDKEGFYRVLSAAEQKQKLEEEVKNVEESEKEEIEQLAKSTETKALSVEMEGSETFKKSPPRYAYALAEELALREVENELRVSFVRQVSIGNNYKVDGIYLDNDKPVVIEIKLARILQHARIIIIRELERFAAIVQSMNLELSFIFVLVVDDFSNEQRVFAEKELLTKIKNYKLSINIRIFDFDELKEKYGITENRD